MSFFEIIGFIAGVAGVWLAAKENPWNWLAGIVSVSIYVFVFFDAQLYGDMTLQLFYIVMGFYGWYLWIRGGNNSKLAIGNWQLATARNLILVSGLGFIVVLFLLKKTDTDVPYLDAMTTVLSLSATWMMARKYIQHWLVWIVVDLAYVGLYMYKSLYLTALLYFIFAALAVYGFFEWKKTIKLQPA